ncbi:MAG: FtsX-like permease family protein, partial [Bacilli bacterium]
NSNDKGNKSNYFSTELVNDYKINALQKTGVLVPVVKEKDFKNILRDFPCNNEISAKTTYSDEVELLIKIIDIFKNIAFYVSLVFLVFTIFLISNFIFTSIHYRKKEIGVLRALGARSLDIIKIFLWEGFIIALISGIISSIVLVICSNNLNYVLMKEIGLLLTPLIVSIRQFGLIFLVVILVVLISSVIPLLKISKMKPIDAILNK